MKINKQTMNWNLFNKITLESKISIPDAEGIL